MLSTQVSLLLLLSPQSPISDIWPDNPLLLRTGHERRRVSMAFAPVRRRAPRYAARVSNAAQKYSS